MAWHFDLGNSVTVQDSSALTLPAGDWTFGGWLRIDDNTGSNIPRILSWGDNASSLTIFVFHVETTTNFSNTNHLCAVVRDGTHDTDVITLDTLDVSDVLGEWLFLCVTHDDSTATTYLRVLDPVADVIRSESSSEILGPINISEPLFFGWDSNYAANRRFRGDLANWFILPNVFTDFEQFRALIKFTRPYQVPGVSMHVPMLRGRYEEWIEQLTVTNNGTSEASSHPPLRLITPQALNTLPINNLSHSIFHTVNFDQTSSYFIPNEDVSSVISLTSSASAARDIQTTACNSLSLTSIGGRSFTFNVASSVNMSDILIGFNLVDARDPVGNILNLSQTLLASSNPDASNTLNFTQSVEAQYPIKPSISHVLSLSSKTSTPHRAFISQSLGVSHFLPTPLTPQHITQNLELIQDSPIGLFDHTLNLTQDVAFSFSLTASNTLSMTHEMSREMVYIRDIEHEDVLGHAFTWYEDSPCGKKNYTPFQGENTIPDAVSAPRNTLQDPQGDTGNFSLYTPYLGAPTSKITMRAPELDNRDRNAFSRVYDETRGGKVLVYSDPQWPKVRTLVVTIVGLKENDVDEFQDFMVETLGQEIGLTDWEGRLWKGFIKNPNEPAVQDGKERWTITFEFEGEMLTVEQPGSDNGDGMTLNITQSVAAVIV